MYNVTLGHLRVIMYVFVASGIQHAKRMRHIIASSVTCLAVPYFFHIISLKARISKKKVIDQKLCICSTNIMLTLSRLMTYIYVVPHR